MEQTEKSKGMFTLKRDANELIREFYLEQLELDSIIVKKLKDDLLLQNFGDLLDKDVIFIDEVLDDIGFVTRNFKNELRHNVHKRGFVLKNEFEYLGISDELGMVPVWELKLKANTSNALMRKDIYVLGDILILTHRELTELFPKEEMVKEILDSIGKLGLSLKEENNKRR